MVSLIRLSTNARLLLRLEPKEATSIAKASPPSTAFPHSKERYQQADCAGQSTQYRMRCQQFPSLVEEASHATARGLGSQLWRSRVDLREGLEDGGPAWDDGIPCAGGVPVAAILVKIVLAGFRW